MEGSAAARPMPHATPATKKQFHPRLLPRENRSCCSKAASTCSAVGATGPTGLQVPRSLLQSIVRARSNTAVGITSLATHFDSRRGALSKARRGDEVSRRGFIATGGAAAVGAASVLSGQVAQAQQPAPPQ